MGQAMQCKNLDYRAERTDLAAAYRWTARLNMHEAAANHFSPAVGDDGRRFLMGPGRRRFSRIEASDLLLLDAGSPETMNQPNAPGPAAWGLHGPMRRLVPRARCAMHVHSFHSAALACLKDSALRPIDQNAATFHGRTAVDGGFGGLAFEEEGTRCARRPSDPNAKAMMPGDRGVPAIGGGVADTFNRLCRFERAAETHVRALQTGKPLRALSREAAERTAREIESCSGQAGRHPTELKAILDEGGSDCAS